MTTNKLQNETIGTWEDRDLTMRWAIYDEESWQDYAAGDYTDIPDIREEARAAYRNIKLNLKAPKGAPDGLYNVVNYSAWGEGEASGAEIRDGYFVPEPTARACFEALCRSDRVYPQDVLDGVSGVCHIFIEELNYDPKTWKLIAGLGS